MKKFYRGEKGEAAVRSKKPQLVGVMTYVPFTQKPPSTHEPNHHLHCCDQRLIRRQQGILGTDTQKSLALIDFVLFIIK